MVSGDKTLTNRCAMLTYDFDRLFPYSVTVGALGVFFLLVILVLRNTNKLIPNFIMVGSFILFVLNLTGLIEEAIELFGPGGANSMCSASNLVANGATVQSLAFLAQSTICEHSRTGAL